MSMVTKRLLLLGLFAIVAPLAPAGAPGDEPPAEIRLGKAPEPAPKPDPAFVRAAERFLAARQSASLDRAKEAGVRRWLSKAAKADAATLIGSPGQTLVAFDFSDGAIERLGIGGFHVSVYLLFADSQGRIVESRDEMLTFVGSGGNYICGSLRTTGTMTWRSDEIEKSAARLSARDALDRADEFLRTWVKRQNRNAAYSIEDFYPGGTGQILVPCLKFSAEQGKRGYDVVDSPIIMKQGPKGYQVEPSTN